jgi:hypothetical protein
MSGLEHQWMVGQRFVIAVRQVKTTLTATMIEVETVMNKGNVPWIRQEGEHKIRPYRFEESMGKFADTGASS